MDLPSLKYTYADGRKASEFMLRDGIEMRYVQQPDGNGTWHNRAGLALTQLMDASHGQEANQSGQESRQGDVGVQSRNTEKRQARSRQGSKGQKPQAGNRNCPI